MFFDFSRNINNQFLPDTFFRRPEDLIRKKCLELPGTRFKIACTSGYIVRRLSTGKVYLGIHVNIHSIGFEVVALEIDLVGAEGFVPGRLWLVKNVSRNLDRLGGEIGLGR